MFRIVRRYYYYYFTHHYFIHYFISNDDVLFSSISDRILYNIILPIYTFPISYCILSCTNRNTHERVSIHLTSGNNEILNEYQSINTDNNEILTLLLFLSFLLFASESLPGVNFEIPPYLISICCTTTVRIGISIALFLIGKHTTKTNDHSRTIVAFKSHLYYNNNQI